MTARRVHVVTLLILALIFGAAQCVASCTGDSLKPRVPPCHQHQAPGHATSAPCTLDSLLPDAQASPLAHIAVIGFAAAVVESAHVFVVDEILTSAAFSPPLSSSILRI
jgi:hypothetical protein